MMIGETFRFADPMWLWLLAALPGLIGWRLFVARRRRGTLRYSDVGLMQGLSVAAGRVLLVIPGAMRQVALALLVVAMARPQAGDVRRDVLTEGVDIVLVLDCSGSMEATDFRPNRLGAAKEVIAEFVRGRHSDRIGLVVFGDSSFTVCPLTADYRALTDFLDRVRIGVVPPDGTAIGEGMVNALHRLRDSEAKSKVIILLTDGDNNRGTSPREVARIAGDLGVKVYTIGVGTSGHRDPRSGFNPELLREISRVTGARDFHASDRSALESIYEQIDEMERTEVEYNVYAQWDELMTWLVWPALGLFATEILLRRTRLMQVP
jgi:Ca-activated chloride channel family protein